MPDLVSWACTRLRGRQLPPKRRLHALVQTPNTLRLDRMLDDVNRTSKVGALVLQADLYELKGRYHD